MFCRKCGNKLSDDMKFCDRCGVKLAGETDEHIITTSVVPRTEKNLTLIGLTLIGILISGILFGIYYYTTNILPQKKYEQALEYEKEDFSFRAYELYIELGEYKDSANRREVLAKNLERNYQNALAGIENGDYGKAYEIFLTLETYKDSKEQSETVMTVLEEGYLQAIEYFENQEYERAEKLFSEMLSYKESKSYFEKCGDCAIVGHEYFKEYCTDNSVCAVCGDVVQDAKECITKEATCTKAKQCSVCSRVFQEALGHDWGNQYPCLQGTPCIRCGEGAPRHDWYNKNMICTVCNEGLYYDWRLRGPAKEMFEGIWLDEASIDENGARIALQMYSMLSYAVTRMEVTFYDSNENELCYVDLFYNEDIAEYLFTTSREDVYVFKAPKMSFDMIERIDSIYIETNL